MEHTQILLIEDDPGHARLIEKNLRRIGLANTIIFINNGQSAIDYLEDFIRGPEISEYPLVLLDLNLPGLSGYEVLKWIKGDQRTKKIPVIILTTTDIPQEIAKCYELGCNMFVTKPVPYEDFCLTIRNLGLLLSIAKLPNSGQDTQFNVRSRL